MTGLLLAKLVGCRSWLAGGSAGFAGGRLGRRTGLSSVKTARSPGSDDDDDDQLDRVFRALADRTRRAILRRLSAGSATVTELAVLSGMSLPGVSKHLTVLEQAGLVARTVQGRLRQCTVTPVPLQEASTWLAEYRSFWESALDSLADYMATAPRRDEPGAGSR